MPVNQLDTFRRLNPRPCTPEQLAQEFGKLRQLLLNAENGLIPGFGGGGTTLPIGTVLMWALGPGAIPSGWAIMDGIANVSGSGIDMTGRFPRGNATTAGGTGGSTLYTPTGSVSLSLTGGLSTATITFDSNVDVTISGSDLSGTLNIPVDVDLTALQSDTIIIADHLSHRHIVEGFLATAGDGGDIYVLNSPEDTTLEDLDDNDGTFHRKHFADYDTQDPVVATFADAPIINTYAVLDKTYLDHTHTAYIAASTAFNCSITGDIDGTATFTGDSDVIEPPYADLIFIERIS